jgi:hypothetical protein
MSDLIEQLREMGMFSDSLGSEEITLIMNAADALETAQDQVVTLKIALTETTMKSDQTNETLGH